MSTFDRTIYMAMLQGEWFYRRTVPRSRMCSKYGASADVLRPCRDRLNVLSPVFGRPGGPGCWRWKKLLLVGLLEPLLRYECVASPVVSDCALEPAFREIGMVTDNDLEI